MTIEELAAKLGVEESIAARAVVANGFSIDDVNDANQHLVEMHTEYLTAVKEADDVKNNFKYSDGEESVDKTKVYDNYRKHYQDLLSAWKDAKELYDRSTAEEGSRFHLRKRADWLDRGRTSIRRPSR